MAAESNDRMEVLRRALRGLRKEAGKEAIGSLLSAATTAPKDDEDEDETPSEEG